MPTLDLALKRIMGALKAAEAFYARIDGINAVLDSTVVRSGEARRVGGDYDLFDEEGNICKASGEFFASTRTSYNKCVVVGYCAYFDYDVLDNECPWYWLVSLNPISTKTTKKTVQEFWNNWTNQVGASKKKQPKKWPGSLRISEGDVSATFPAKGKPVQLSHGKLFKAKVAWVYMRDLKSIQEVNTRIVAPLRKQLSCKIGG